MTYDAGASLLFPIRKFFDETAETGGLSPVRYAHGINFLPN
jgi:hypothetical protein